MPDLLRKPFGTRGKVHQITPESAGWRYVGFSLYHLRPGDKVAEVTGEREVILVVVEGKVRITGAGQDWGVLGDRMNVFEKTAPHCLYLPNGTDWDAVAETGCTLAVCSAPGQGDDFPLSQRHILRQRVVTGQFRCRQTQPIGHGLQRIAPFRDSHLVARIRDDSPRIRLRRLCVGVQSGIRCVELPGAAPKVEIQPGKARAATT